MSHVGARLMVASMAKISRPRPATRCGRQRLHLGDEVGDLGVGRGLARRQTRVCLRDRSPAGGRGLPRGRDRAARTWAYA